jgi:anti-sigma factor RsiW
MATNILSSSAACPAYEAVLEDYLNGELSVAEANSAEEHWKTCAACRTALEQAAASMRLLRAAGPSADPGSGFARVVMARIRTAEQERAAERTVFWQPFVSWGWKFAATATLVLVGLVTYDAGWGHTSQPTADEVRATAMHDIFGFAPEPGQTPADRDEVLMMVAETSHGN